MQRFLRAIVVLLVVVVAGCRSDPIYNADDIILTPPAGATLADIQKAILRAGATRGWVMQAEAPGQMVGTLRVRSHVAVVDIRYSRERCSIRYRSSENLNYDDGDIHPNYNSWVRNLEADIQREVTLL